MVPEKHLHDLGPQSCNLSLQPEDPVLQHHALLLQGMEHWNRGTDLRSLSIGQPLTRDHPGADPYHLDDLPGIDPHQRGTAHHRSTGLRCPSTAQWTDADPHPLGIGLQQGSASRHRPPESHLGHWKGIGPSQSQNSVPHQGSMAFSRHQRSARHLRWRHGSRASGRLNGLVGILGVYE